MTDSNLNLHFVQKSFVFNKEFKTEKLKYLIIVPF